MKTMPECTVWPGLTICGAGRALEIIKESARFGAGGLIIHGRSLAAGGNLAGILAAAPAGVEVATLEHAGGEPDLNHLEKALQFARRTRAGWIAGIGGGSVLDIAKACAGLFNAAGELGRYHDGQPIERPGVPFIAAPTTAGTGSEATINAVLTNPQTRQKKSIRTPMLMARVIILDPVLMRGAPPRTIASAGLDALTQAVEAYTSRMATWLSDQLALKAVKLIAANLEAVYRGAGDEPALALLQGSYLAGVAFSMARLGVVHGLAHPLGVRYHAPHGLVCGVCLPYAVELNRAAMGEKYGILSAETGADLLECTRAMPGRLGLASPFKGKELIEKETIIAETLKSWSTAANAKPVTRADVEWLLAGIFQS